MPVKRKVEDFDPTKSDSADSTYGASTSRNVRSKPSKSQRSKPSQKRQRRDYDGSDDISAEDDISEDSFREESRVQDEVTDYDDVTGRPKRKAKEQRQTYHEPDSDEDIIDSASEHIVAPKRRKITQSKIVKLKLTTPKPVRRSTRARSGSVSARPSSATLYSAARRSSRIAHDETEPIVALTDSGHHANVVRPGTRSPPSGGVPRSRVGGKGPKKGPVASVVYEEESSSGQTKDEPVAHDSFHQLEVAASRENLGEAEEDPQSQPFREADMQNVPHSDPSGRDPIGIDDGTVIPESADEGAQDPGEDDSDGPIAPRRTTRRIDKILLPVDPRGHQAEPSEETVTLRRNVRSAAEKRKTRTSQKTGREESSDFEPGADEGEEENVSDSGGSQSSPRKADDDSSSSSRRNTRAAKGRSQSRRNEPSDADEGGVADELAEELEDLRGSRSRRGRRSDIIYEDKPQTRKRKRVDYRILRPDLVLPMEDEGPAETVTPSRRARGGGGGGWQRSLYSTYGPFGGAGGPPPVFGGPGGIAAAGGVDSDSSDDEVQQRPRAAGYGGTVGMTPTTGPQGFGLFQPAQTHGADPLPNLSGTPANLGKVQDKQALADADPLGVDKNVSFDSVGGLQGHIDQLKEMVALPLLYPEVFQRFHVTPPRGVLFHGPPGTGKTLLARALASSVSSQGRKVTFYMRKGADALSKWVGEAERQLRLLFEEARKTQPSIIFFDEIDGLAPVRSSKQEQIHSSIVSTLLALMDGMDGRGQVIVIGATNRPDSVDPALRRPGRFDREFYFPLPNVEARRAILDIHTKDWDPPLASSFKEELATLTKGYGGADLRALCTEAALNAVQRRYPQIYKSNEKLQIDTASIKVVAKDFMISVKKLVPSSERSTSSVAAPLPTNIAPLLRQPLAEIENVVNEILPQKKRLTALEEAEFEDAEDDKGMRMERMQQEFERSRVFRPRLLLAGAPGMGQQYLAAALLHRFEALHIQAFDLPTLLSDSTRSPEAAVVQLFAEVRRHKPSVIFIPGIDVWYQTVGDAVVSTFTGLLRSLAPTEPIMLLGVLEADFDRVDRRMISSLFGYSRRNQFTVERPGKLARRDYFQGLADYLMKAPTDFPEPMSRKKRRLELLPRAPPEPAKPLAVLSKQQLKAQKKHDRHLLNLLKLRIHPIMDQIRVKNKKFRTGVIEESQIRYLYDEEDPSMVNTDLPQGERCRDEFRPYEKGKDDHGEPGLIEVSSGKFFYNMEIVTIEKRLSNGYYKRPKDFLSDIKKLTKDAKAIGDQDRLLKANELQANVEVDMGMIETADPTLIAELEQVYVREMNREKEVLEKQKRLMGADEERRLQLMPPDAHTDSPGLPTGQSTGPVVLGEPMTNGVSHHPVTPSNLSHPSHSSSLSHQSSIPISDLSDLQPHYNQSNGTSVPSREDVQVSNSQDRPSTSPPEKSTEGSSFGQSAQTRPFASYTGARDSLGLRKSIHGLSQTSAVTPMAEGSNPQDYANYASTTSSEKRNTGSSAEKINTQSDRLGTQSDKGNTQNTQNSNGLVADGGTNSSPLAEDSIHASQFPDTQTQAQNLQAASQLQSSARSHLSSQGQSQPPVPPFTRPQPSISALLNADNSDPPRSSSRELPKLNIDPLAAEDFINHAVEESSGLSVEQLEQVYSLLMDKIWKTRDVWNRVDVTNDVKRTFDECISDMDECQQFQQKSLDSDFQY
ncbi:MAG: hypothetical protein LQ348_000374 [Seirophora lacunosa]|nr:MAG: hypothetical protein LQ348_000374 [Seirophora lacunosa]